MEGRRRMGGGDDGGERAPGLGAKVLCSCVDVCVVSVGATRACV